MHSWEAGGIFGQSGADAVEVLDEMDGGPYPDGMGGFRDRPGLGPAVPWVLEMPFGFARRHRIARGDIATVRAGA
jgi:hypothetical protein